ncbi:MAG: polysaccharide biosynthesis protein [Ruminococcaceae bacterium]|nr:polysaccharide biosynthesis protein [Oscillospiraceae bacterium]
MEKTNKKTSFMINVAIVMFSQIAVKLLGMVYRVVITNIRGFGDLGNGYLNAGFQVYTLLLAVSSIGIPNAISKMTSERNAIGDYKGAHRIFKSALILFSAIGLAASALLYFGADFIAREIIRMPGTSYVLMCLAPSILFVCVSSVIRGYFVGMENMKATSSSQVLEQFFKCTLTVLIVYVLAFFPSVLETLYDISPQDADRRAMFMAAGAQVATTVSTVLSFLYLYFFYKKRSKDIKEKMASSDAPTLTDPIGTLFKSILMISIPISLGSIISAVNRLVDTATITRGIEVAFAQVIPGYSNIPQIVNPTLEQLQKEAARLSGQLGKCDALINLPLALNISFSTVLVPAIAGALAKGDKKSASEKVIYSLLISILIIMPCAAGYIVLAKPIYGMLYPNAQLGYDLMQISSIAMIFTALNQTISGSLQGCGKVLAPSTGLLIGCTAKFILNIILIRQPQINIYGAPIGSIVCQVISFTYGFTVLKRQVSLNLSLKKFVVKPVIATSLMGLATVIVYKVTMLLTSVNLLATILSIGVAVLLYAFLIIAMRIMSEEEIIMLPSGARILRTVKKLGFYK